MYRQLKKYQLEERIVKFEKTLAERRIVARRSQERDELFVLYRRREQIPLNKCDDEREKKIVERDFEEEFRQKTLQHFSPEPTSGEIDVRAQKWLKEMTRQNEWREREAMERADRSRPNGTRERSCWQPHSRWVEEREKKNLFGVLTSSVCKGCGGIVKVFGPCSPGKCTKTNPNPMLSKQFGFPFGWEESQKVEAKPPYARSVEEDWDSWHAPQENA